MMRRRASVALLAGVLLAGLSVVPAHGQGTDAFVVSPDRGVPGDIVDGQVDPDLVEEHCITDIGVVQEMFANLGPGPGPVFEAWLERLPLVGFDEDLGNAAMQVLFLALNGSLTDPVTLEQIPATVEQMVSGLTFLAIDAIGGGGGADIEIAEDYLAQTFVLTFADPITEEPVGSPSSFSPVTGEGQIKVPDLDPGLWAVAATCVEPVITDESFLAAVEAGVQWWEENEDELPPPFPEWNQASSEEAAPLVAEVVLPVLMQPQPDAGPWIDFYCILQDDGFCATPPGPVGLIDDEVLDEFNGDEPGIDLPDPDAEGLDDTGDLVAVDAAPSFTG